MKKLKEEEQIKVIAGANPYVIAGAISAIVAFVIGLFSGYSNPEKCNN